KHVWRPSSEKGQKRDAMKRAFYIFVFAIADVLLAQSARAQHEIVLQGNGTLAILDRGGAVKWQMPWEGIHDINLSTAGKLMVQQGANKVVEIDVAKKEVVWSYDSAIANGNAGRRVEVHAFQPLTDGSVMIAESGPARIVEVDRAGKLLREVKLKVDHP